LLERELSDQVLAEHASTALPERDALSLVNANLAVPVDLAAALNVLSDNSTAQALAYQEAPITQTS
jgi:hypothetical protein